MTDEIAKNPVGRPPIEITEEQWSSLFKTISSTSLGIRRICGNLGLPFDTIWDRIITSEDFSKRYVQAKENQALYLSEEVMDISDDGTNDTYMTPGKDEQEGIERTNHEVVNRSKLRVDSRKWVIERLQHKRYGNKVGITDGDGKPVEFKLTIASELEGFFKK